MKSFKLIFLIIVLLTVYSGNIYSHPADPVLQDVFALGVSTLDYNLFTSFAVWGSGEALGSDGSCMSAYSYGIVGGVCFGLAGLYGSNFEIALRSPDSSEASQIRQKYGIMGAVTGLICGNIYGYYNSNKEESASAIKYRLNYKNNNLNFSVKRKI